MNLPLLLLCFFLWKVLPPQQTTNTRCHTCFPVDYEFTIIAWLVDISVDFLLRYTHSEDTTTYAGVMWEAFGRVGSVFVQGCVMITIPGCLIIYLIIIGKCIYLCMELGCNLCLVLVTEVINTGICLPALLIRLLPLNFNNEQPFD
jgi:hypothetical protein